MAQGNWPNKSFTGLAGIDLPIVQAGIGEAAVPALAAAVSNAGGLGMLGLAGASPDDARKAVRATRALTDRPFGANMVLHWPPDEVVPVLIKEGVQIFSFNWGDFSRFIEPVRRAGGIILFSVGSVEEARLGADLGVDAIVAQGWEAGGHVRGTTSTMALIPAVVDAVGTLPVLAAGGIADGRGVAAALALGAAGVWIGTRYLAATEAPLIPDYRSRVLAAEARDTFYTSDLFDVGWPEAPHRVLRNRTVDLWERAGRPPSGARPGEGEIIGTTPGGNLPRYSCATPVDSGKADVDDLSMWC